MRSQAIASVSIAMLFCLASQSSAGLTIRTDIIDNQLLPGDQQRFVVELRAGETSTGANNVSAFGLTVTADSNLTPDSILIALPTAAQTTNASPLSWRAKYDYTATASSAGKVVTLQRSK